MKNIFRISGVILVIISIFLFHSCEEKPTPPIISTTAVTAISYTTATSGGNVTNEGGASVASKGICWNTSLDPTTANSKTTDGTGTGSFNSSLTGLTAGTTYYVRAYATNTAGTGYGNQVTFSTLQVAVPTLTTTAITSITSLTAASGGNITADNGSSVTARGVCWSTSANPTIALITKTTDGTGTGAFTSSITGLTPNTTYYIKAYATNSAGTAYGLEISFKTYATQPTLTTTSASVITTTTALSGGNITADGGAAVTARGVCWSTSQNPTTSNYYTTNGSGIGSFTSSITSLTTNTTYYIRAYATNSAGTAYGNQVSFTTSAAPVVPTLTTTAASSITSTTATSGGNISSDGGAAVTARGVCWSTSQNPTTANSKTIDSNGAGSFTSSLTALTSNITYYVRAYATNSVGTGYGSVISFTTSNSGILFNPNKTYGTVTDIEGNVYKTITIGTQTWMAENVKTTHYNNTNFISIPNKIGITNVPGVYWWYNNDIANKTLYGALYDLTAVMTGNLCPTGWHVPTYYEWTTLMNYLGGWGVVDGKLKETGTSHWISPNVDATNSSGFTALPGGMRNYSGWFGDIGYATGFWTTTEIGNDGWAYRFELNHDNWNGSGGAYRNWFDERPSSGFSVRCVKN